MDYFISGLRFRSTPAIVFPICYQLIEADVILLWQSYNSDVGCVYCPSKVTSRFAPPSGKFDKIILFIGGNDLYEGFEPSSETPAKVVRDLIELANCLVPQANEVIVLGIPETKQNKPRSKAVNDILEKTALRTSKQTSPGNWKIRSVGTYISGAG